MISKRDCGAFVLGVLVAEWGFRWFFHAFYLAAIIGLSVGYYLK